MRCGRVVVPSNTEDDSDLDFLEGERPQRQFPGQECPQPPADLWDVTDTTLLEAVRCEAFIRIAQVDPKHGTFRVRMKCIWSFRTQNSHEDTELHLRGVPGIRMPGLIEAVEESRVWKDISSMRTTRRTIFWKGISLFTMDGFKAFHMQPFPFDRHILNLERLEFVWRPDKDAQDYYKSMRVVSLTVKCSSMLPEWRTLPAYVRELSAPSNGRVIRRQTTCAPYNSPGGAGGVEHIQLTHASKFSVHLRIQRYHQYYTWQVFLVTYLITVLSLFPLGMHPESLADRVAVYAGGTLTLVAFKYSVSDHMPSVPYLTLTDKFLLAQILTLFMCAVLALLTYRIARLHPEWRAYADHVEHVVGLLLLAAWSAGLWVMSGDRRWRVKWSEVLKLEHEAQDSFNPRDEPGAAEAVLVRRATSSSRRL